MLINEKTVEEHRTCELRTRNEFEVDIRDCQQIDKGLEELCDQFCKAATQQIYETKEEKVKNMKEKYAKVVRRQRGWI